MIRFVVVFVVQVMWAGAALAQISEDFQVEFDAAFAQSRAQNWDAALDHAREALTRADTNEERFRGNAALADVAEKAENWQLAYTHAGAAIAIIDEHYPDSPDALFDMLRIQGVAALYLVRRVEAHTLIERRLGIDAASNELRFRYEDLAVRHRFTGYPCPIVEGNAVFDEAHSFNPHGTDVSCAYAWPGSPQPVITVHIYRVGDIGAEQTYEDAFSSVASVFPEATLTERSDGEIAGFPVSFASWDMPDRQAYLWTTFAYSWAIKLRVTTYRETAREDLNALAGMVFAGAPDLASHLERCAALTGVETVEGPRDDMGLEAALTALLNPGETIGSEQPAGDFLSCYIGDLRFDGEDGVAYAEIDESGTVMRYVARPARPTGIEIVAQPGAFVLNRPDEQHPHWTLSYSQPEGRLIFPRFESQPSPTGFARVTERVLLGEIRPVSRVTVDEAGNSNVSLFTDPEDGSDEIAPPPTKD